MKIDYGYNPEDYITLGQYQGIEVSVDTESIKNGLINDHIKSEQEDNTTYSDVSRGAVEGDKVICDFAGSIKGQMVNGFSDNDYSLVLGKDTFVVDGFIDQLYGMKAGESKVAILEVPESFSSAPEYAGSKIVFEITVTAVQQPLVPMVTDAYVKEKFNLNSVEEYRNSVEEEIKDTIDEKLEAAKKEAVLSKLQDNCTVKGYPEDFLNSQRDSFEQSIKFYALMQGKSNDEYCQDHFGISFEEYVKKAVAQQLILQAIAQKEKMTITEYEYKGDLEAFVKRQGSTDKDNFVEKYGRDKVVQSMLAEKAQNLVMETAVYK